MSRRRMNTRRLEGYEIVFTTSLIYPISDLPGKLAAQKGRKKP
jgi:hypothetical protein